jgi:ABC-2 type transport system permease protein
MLVVSNSLKATFRKKENIIIYVFLPLLGVILSLLLYGTSGASTLRVGLVNHDNGTISEDLKGVLSSKEGIQVSDVEDEAINSLLLDMNIDLAVVIPEGFSKSVYSGDIKDIEIVSLKGQETTAWIMQLLNNYTDTLAKLSAASAGDSVLFDKMLDQYKDSPDKLNVVVLKDKRVGKLMTSTSIGFLIMFMMYGVNFTSSIILKEKRTRTYYRICTAPVNSRQYIAANAITSLMITLIQIILIMLIMRFVFRIDTGLSGASMFIILFMFGVVAVGIGLALTAFSGSSYMASTLSTLVTTPTCMLGGCFWEVELMPKFMQRISLFTPQRWALDAVEIMQNGGTWSDISLNLLVLAAFALALILVASYKFSRTENLQKFI